MVDPNIIPRVYTSPAGKRVWELAGSDPSLPAVALQRRSHALQGIALGLKVSEPGIAAPVIPSAAQQTDSTGQQHRMLSDCITSYLAETREHKAERTFLAYRETLGLFILAVKREHIEDITREDMLAFGAFLKKRGMRRARSAIVSITLRSSCTISDYLRCSKGKYFPKYTEKQVRLPPYRVGSDVWPIDAGRV
jgi:hypothetical protein